MEDIKEFKIIDNYEEFKKLVNVFSILLKQARNMSADYYNELEHLCKVIIAEQATKMKNFTVELFLGTSNAE